MSTQISAYISDETKAEAEAFVKKYGITQARLIEEAVPMGIDSLVASISSKNEESIAFHRKNGFRECGRFEWAGRKNDQDFDIVWMQRRLPPTAA
mgnify:CR=1 FL=1